MKKTSAAIGAFLLMAACATAQAADDKAAQSAISDAKAAAKKAASIGGQWRDTGKIIEKAEKAAAGGDLAKAIKLAKQAKFQAEAGYKQATNQAARSYPPKF